MSEERGPGWYDVSTHCTWMFDELHVSVSFKLVPPLRRLDGRGFSAWVAVVLVTERGGAQPREWAQQETFGTRGQWKTAPSALLQALIDITEKIQTARENAAAQAAF